MEDFQTFCSRECLRTPHLIHEQLKSGVRETDIVAEVNKFLYTHGSDDVEAVIANRY